MRALRRCLGCRRWHLNGWRVECPLCERCFDETVGYVLDPKGRW